MTALLNTIMEAVRREYQFAANKFGNFNSQHEGYAILKEEVDELWDAVKDNDQELAVEEAVQVAAMAMRFVIDSGIPESEFLAIMAARYA